jgi:hypothetical protein
MVLLHASDILRISVDEERGLLETEWLDYARGDALRQGLNAMLRTARERQVPGWVANQRHMRTISPADQQWINDYFMPALARLPLRRFALVVSEDPLNRMAMKSILQRASGLLQAEVQSFDGPAEARRWAAQGSSSPGRR